MTWVRLDDRFPEHSKIVACGDSAAWLHICGICYAARNLTDGFVSERVAARLTGSSRWRQHAQALLDQGLWEKVDRGWNIHDYLEYNPSRAEVEANRNWDRKRKELNRDRDLIAAIRARDGDRCRYCGRGVNWRDRKGSGGGTYDHVIPRGANSYDNVVVACRQCNIRKGGRTPEEAGMPLMDPPDPLGSSPDLARSSPESSPPARGRGGDGFLGVRPAGGNGELDARAPRGRSARDTADADIARYQRWHDELPPDEGEAVA